MELDGAWVLLAGVELFAEQLRQHLVHSDVGKEAIVILEKLSLVFELMEVALKFVKSDDLGDRWDVQVLNLVFEFARRVFDDDTNP